MLKTVLFSSAKKTGGCAVTYRSGRGDLYSTCPNTCALKPAGNTGAESVALDYLDALVDAVPKKGAAFTYLGGEPADKKYHTKCGDGGDRAYPPCILGPQ